jgi:hypothetical protein
MSALDKQGTGSIPQWVPRLLAGVLAIGGTFWGFLLSPWLFRPDASPTAWLVFGPGYLVTLSYYLRAFSMPPNEIRLLIWFVSLIVQGAWLLFMLWGIIPDILAGRSINEPSLPLAWWVFATIASAFGLVVDRAKEIETGVKT